MAKSSYPGYTQAYQELAGAGIEVKGRGGSAPSEAYLRRVYNQYERQTAEGRSFDRSLARGHKAAPIEHLSKEGKRPEQYRVGDRSNPPYVSDVAKMVKRAGKKDFYTMSITGSPEVFSGGKKDRQTGSTRTYSVKISGAALRKLVKHPMSIEDFAELAYGSGWNDVTSINIMAN